MNTPSVPPYIDERSIAGRLDWPAVVDAIATGHRRPRARLGDLLLGEGEARLLTRAAWIEGLGIGLKSVSVMAANALRSPPLPTVQGVMVLFDAATGAVQALLDGAMVTRWKTAADSVLGARLLARPDSRRLLVVGSGAVARSLVAAYSACLPGLQQVSIWNRTPARAAELAAELAAEGCPCAAVTDLPAAAGAADIIATATLAREPVLRGAWVRPGAHVDLIGAYTPQMREADDELMRRARVFVDCRDTTVHHIGELMIPIAAGVIGEGEVLGDLYDLIGGEPGRLSEADLTLFKNGGGAHLDLMTAALILARARGGS